MSARFEADKYRTSEPAPPPVNAGHEVHVSRRYAMGAMSARARFVAKCSCGWEGKVRQQTPKESVPEQAAFRAAKDAVKHQGAK